MTKTDDRLKDLDVRLNNIPCRAVTPPDDDDDGKDQCPNHGTEPGGLRNN